MEHVKYSDIYDFENLYLSVKDVIKGKRFRKNELQFINNLEEELIKLQNDLIWKTYTHEPFREFYVYDPKKRLISAPCLRDRVVHTAVCRVVESIIDPRLDYDSYACRVGKGTLQAANRAAYHSSKYLYFAYFDIRRFFDSITISKLEEVYEKRFIKDDDIMWLLHTIFMKDCKSKGLKKGCRTSQLSANVFLNELDHYLRHTLKVKAYVRYMDDFIIFHNDRAHLQQIIPEVQNFLQAELFLDLNDKTYIGTTRKGFEFVGYYIFPKYKIVRRLVMNRARKTYKKWLKGEIDDVSFYRSIASHVGHCEGTSSYKWFCEYLLKALHDVLEK